MSLLKTLHKPNESATQIIISLQNVLTNSYGLYHATHNYHWNVEGINFVSLHKLFSDQYNELFLAIDTIAERIRALDYYALPFEGDNIKDILITTSNALNKYVDANTRATKMVHNLIEMNESVIQSCQMAKDEARMIADDETQDLMIGRITAHEKALWMLKSVIK
jgi:starvation-inducible DNA-binding protein